MKFGIFSFVLLASSAPSMAQVPVGGPVSLPDTFNQPILGSVAPIDKETGLLVDRAAAAAGGAMGAMSSMSSSANNAEGGSPSMSSMGSSMMGSSGAEDVEGATGGELGAQAGETEAATGGKMGGGKMGGRRNRRGRH